MRADNSPLYALPTLRRTLAACRVRRKFICDLNLSSVCAFTLATEPLRGTSWHKHQPDLRISTTRLPTPRDRPVALRMHSPMLLRMCPARRAIARPTSSIPQTPRLVRPWAHSSGRSATLLRLSLIRPPRLRWVLGGCWAECIDRSEFWQAAQVRTASLVRSRETAAGLLSFWRVADRRCLRRLAIVRALQRAPVASYTEQ